MVIKILKEGNFKKKSLILFLEKCHPKTNVVKKRILLGLILSTNYFQKNISEKKTEMPRKSKKQTGRSEWMKKYNEIVKDNRKKQKEVITVFLNKGNDK